MYNKTSTENTSKLQNPTSSRWIAIAPFLLLFMLIIVAATEYLYIRQQYRAAKKAAQTEISSVANLKAGQIENWYKDRIKDAEIVSNNIILQMKVQLLFSNPDNADLKQEILQWMVTQQKYYEYKLMVLYDSEGRPLLSVPEGLAAFDISHNQYFQAALRSKDILPIDLHKDHDTWKYIHLSVYIPIRNNIPIRNKQGANDLAKGAWMIQIDPNLLLYPLIQTWPSARQSAETLLVRREGDDVLFLNELRHRQNTALELRLPIDPDRRLPAAMALTGHEGIIEGLDYRNEPVLADARKIKGTNWFMVAKIDRKEIYAGMYQQILLNGIALLALLLSASLAIRLLTRQHDNRMLKEQLALEQERSAAIEALAESRQKTAFFADVIEKSSQPFLVGYPDGRIGMFNDAFAKLLGYSKEEIEKINQAHHFAPIRSADEVSKLQELNRTGQPVRYEKEYIRKDGMYAPIELLVHMVRKENGQPDYYYAFITDITERKLAEKAVLESKERLQLALTAANHGMYDLDIETGEAKTNPEYAMILGYDPATFVETNDKWIERLHPDDREGVSKTYRAYIEGKLPTYQVEFRQRTKSGDWKWILSLGKILEYSAEGKPLRMLGTHTDITGRKQAEERMLAANEEIRMLLEEAEQSRQALLSVVEDQKEAQRQIGKLNAELEQRVQERTAGLEAANRELEAFSYSVSHDLRSPLQHITGFGELLNKHAAGSLDEKSRHYLEIIKNSTARMGALIDDLLSFSRMGRADMMRKNVNLDNIVKAVLDDLKTETTERNIEWKINPLPEVTGDPAMLKLVYVNLISNAVKFTKGCEKAIIEIGSTSQDKGEIFFYVKDNGAGFDMKYVDKLFGLFQRLHRSEDFDGTGLGLANVRRIIYRHGGKTWAEGAVGKGATIYFSLPGEKGTGIRDQGSGIGGQGTGDQDVGILREE